MARRCGPGKYDQTCGAQATFPAITLPPVTSEEGTGGEGKAPGPSIVYIGGTGRSGSTLLARLLSGVPGVVAVGELRYVLDRGMTQDHLCGCGRPFRACPFWHDVFQ